MAERKRRYDIMYSNCDCGSGTTAVRADTKRIFGPRCPHCRKVLGWMDYKLVGSVIATGDITAMELWRKEQDDGE